MQLRLATKLTCEAYISREAWEGTCLEQCPRHPRGNCGFASHGGYLRKHPAGLWVRRWYCPQAHQTFSLLPDFAAARLPGTLEAIEVAVATFETDRRAGMAAYEAAQRLRPDIEAQGALRWIRRRRAWAKAALILLVGCAPDLLTQCELTILAARQVLRSPQVLVDVRGLAAVCLAHAPTPVGLAPASAVSSPPLPPRQHDAGPDPPA